MINDKDGCYYNISLNKNERDYLVNLLRNIGETNLISDMKYLEPLTNKIEETKPTLNSAE